MSEKRKLARNYSGKVPKFLTFCGRFSWIWACLSVVFFGKTIRALIESAYHVQTDNFAIGFLHFPQLLKKIPKSRLGNCCVRGKDAHAVKLGCRIGLSWQVPTNDLVLVEAPYTKTCQSRP